MTELKDRLTTRGPRPIRTHAFSRPKVETPPAQYTSGLWGLMYWVSGRFRTERTNLSDGVSLAGTRPSRTETKSSDKKSKRRTALQKLKRGLVTRLSVPDVAEVDGRVKENTMSKENTTSKEHSCCSSTCNVWMKENRNVCPQICHCGLRCAMRTAKIVKNRGKQFWGCSKYKGGCNYFKWCTDVAEEERGTCLKSEGKQVDEGVDIYGL
ncbi:hypothetical protein V8G54_022830 [Vigna mungo]|uniref:GRF-type domain-containing protein n=1 Tax=Vigna mungo TaxID=3915 RepID=A0AAQ3N350_VIGMU